MPEKKASDFTEKNWWVDKAIQLPKGLLLPGVSGEAVAVYAHMKSFGPAAAASLKAIAHRMGWKAPRVRKYQAELWKKGWITLLAEGVGAIEESNPRQWWMASNEMEPPPQELVDRVSKNATLPPQAYKIQQAAENPAPQNSVPEANKDPQANKDLPKQPKKGVHPEQDAFWQMAKDIWKAKHPTEPFTWPNFTSFPKKLYEALETFKANGLAIRWKNMMEDPFSLPDLMSLVSNPNRWAQPRKGPVNGRPFNQPEAPWAPSGR